MARQQKCATSPPCLSSPFFSVSDSSQKLDGCSLTQCNLLAARLSCRLLRLRLRLQLQLWLSLQLSQLISFGNPKKCNHAVHAKMPMPHRQPRTRRTRRGCLVAWLLPQHLHKLHQTIRCRVELICLTPFHILSTSFLLTVILGQCLSSVLARSRSRNCVCRPFYCLSFYRKRRLRLMQHSLKCCQCVFVANWSCSPACLQQRNNSFFPTFPPQKIQVLDMHFPSCCIFMRLHL